MIVQRASQPLAAGLVILLALGFETRVLPWVPGFGQVITLAAFMLAPGVATERILQRTGFDLLERFALTSATSVALTALAGLILHILGFGVTPAHVLASLVLVACAGTLGALAVRPPADRQDTRAKRTLTLKGDDLAAVASVAIAIMCLVILMATKNREALPSLEIMAVDAAGKLQPMPVAASNRSATINIAVRSISGQCGPTTLSVSGAAIEPQPVQVMDAASTWTLVEVPIRFNSAGNVLATIDATCGTTERTLSVAFEVTP